MKPSSGEYTPVPRHTTSQIERSLNRMRGSFAARSRALATSASLTCASLSLPPWGALRSADGIERQERPGRQKVENPTRALVRSFLLRADVHLGLQRRLVRVGNAGELFQFAAARSLVHLHLAVAGGAHVERAIGEDFDEPRSDLRAHLIARLAVWGDGRTDHRHAVTRQQMGDKTDAADVRVAILARKPQTL